MPEDLLALARDFSETRYARFLGLEVIEVSQGYARVTLLARPELHNWSDLTHGGAIMSLADHAFGCCLNTLEHIYVAVQFNTLFIAAPKDGELLVAEGRVLRAGRKVGLAEVSISGESGRPIARCMGTTVPIGTRTTSGGEEARS